MRVLFVPYYGGGLSHIIPLVALNRMIADRGVETAFLFPRISELLPRIAGFVPDQARLEAELGIRILTVQHQGLVRTEMRAYREFSPDVVVDDCSLTTGYASTLRGVPRVTIQRTGTFPGYRPRNPRHVHSMDVDVRRLPDVTSLGLRPPGSFPDLFEAALKIVPGIPEVEVLPGEVCGDDSFVFCGPLLMDDLLVERPGSAASGEAAFRGIHDLDPLERFLAVNEDRDLVYFTYGLIASPPPDIRECVRFLLEEGMAVVTSIRYDDLRDRYPDRYYCASYLPLHRVCSRAKLVVHHCGSATYHYPLLHGIPSLTIGTQCYDRDDVAVRLQELGASQHLPSPVECEGFVDRFGEAVREALAGEVYLARKRESARLGEEVRRVAAAFDFPRLLEELLQPV